MLTRLQVKGFKNLLDVDVRFGPFTCIAGRNAAGKSNLFDAIRFLHLLTRHPIAEAVRYVRTTKGRPPEARSLFTTFGTFTAPEIRFVADLLIGRNVQDDFGLTAEAAISSVRYTLAFRLTDVDGAERLELAEESLVPIRPKEASASLGFPTSREFKDSTIQGKRIGPFISTVPGEAGPQVKVHPEGHGGRRFSAPKSSRTVLGGLASSDFPMVLAMRREMESWRTLFLEPSAMSAPAFYSDERFFDPQGANLPAVIERLRKAEEHAGQVYASLANKLSELIDDIHELRIKDDEKTETYTLEIRGRDGIFRPARSQSDGTLRFLVLAALAIDPELKGVICLEEPENGIHPARIPAMVRLLEDIAVDPRYEVSAENPQRQVIFTTHSPVVINTVSPSDIVYFDETLINAGGALGRMALPRVVEETWKARLQKDIPPVALGQIRPYLAGPPNDHEGQRLIDYFEQDA